MIPFIFKVRLFFALVCAFMVFTVAGTLLHEVGHYAASEYFGFKTRINYRSTLFLEQPYSKEFDSAYAACGGKTKISAKVPCQILDNLYARMHTSYLTVGWAGPVQTMLTGTIGLFLLFFFRRSFQSSAELRLWQWLLVLISCFWLRQVFNFIISAWYAYVHHKLGNGDEINLSATLGLHPLAIGFFTFLAGSMVFLILFFRFIPPAQRFTFLCGGLAGGLLGYYLWFEHIGPLILP